MDLPNSQSHSRNKPLQTFEIVASLPKEFDMIVTHRSFSFKHIILCSIISGFSMFSFCTYVSNTQLLFYRLKFSSCARAFVHPLFYFSCIGCASTRFKMFSEALPKEFNVEEVRAFIFIYIIFNSLQGKLPYIVLLEAGKTHL